MAILAINQPFSSLGLSGRTKLLVLGSSREWVDRIRSLQLEHVSPAGQMRREISRLPSGFGRSESDLIALMRRWFFARKPDAGFLLTDFPATLLQSKVFDEWLESRHEALSAVVAGPGSPESVVTHYASQGLLSEVIP
jgi:adenylate kinase